MEFIFEILRNTAMISQLYIIHISSILVTTILVYKEKVMFAGT